MAIGEVPKIVWGDALENTITFPGPLYNAIAYPEAARGSEWAETPAGVVDAWLVGQHEILEGDVRFLPTSDASGVTGWDGPSGWRAFLVWAWAGKVFRFYPSAGGGTFVQATLRAPRGSAAPAVEDDGTKSIRLVLVAQPGESFGGY